jgi:uncharacterized protein (DUF488 family)
MLYTIGHSTHTIERFIELLHEQGISAVADVRSSPYSKYNPQFNREPFQAVLQNADITYVFLGKELGARIEDPSCYVNGQVQFSRVAATGLFQKGIERLRQGMENYRVSLLCAEKDPIMCHRMILICRHLRVGSFKIQHILETGELENNEAAERRLMDFHGILENDLLLSQEELIGNAYDLQSKRIAYVANKSEPD